MSEHALVLVTCGERAEAQLIARLLVEHSLAAGVQIIPIESVYEWEGAIVEDTETLLIVKTRADRFEAIEAIVGENHSYQVPPVLMVGIDAASKPYLDWIDHIVIDGDLG